MSIYEKNINDQCTSQSSVECNNLSWLFDLLQSVRLFGKWSYPIETGIRVRVWKMSCYLFESV